MKTLILITTSMISASAFSAALCPPSSCNPYNGCVDGCRPFQVKTSASCQDNTYEEAVKSAIQSGRTNAFNQCGGGIYQKTQWKLTDCQNVNYSVSAEATFLCLR